MTAEPHLGRGPWVWHLWSKGLNSHNCPSWWGEKVACSYGTLLCVGETCRACCGVSMSWSGLLNIFNKNSNVRWAVSTGLLKICCLLWTWISPNRFPHSYSESCFLNTMKTAEICVHPGYHRWKRIYFLCPYSPFLSLQTNTHRLTLCPPPADGGLAPLKSTLLSSTLLLSIVYTVAGERLY